MYGVCIKAYFYTDINFLKRIFYSVDIETSVGVNLYS